MRFPRGGGEWIISVGDDVENSFTAFGNKLGSGSLTYHREVRLEL